jgi:mono/diheme cytochrome c family protein
MRTLLLAALSTLSLVGLGACVGGVDSMPPTNVPPGGTPPGTGTSAQPLFDSDVFPIIKTKCATCHTAGAPQGNVTGFVAVGAADGYQTAISYTALVGNFVPTNAAILTKIAAGHQAQTYTAIESGKITAWLNAEVTARNVAPGGPVNEDPATTTNRLLKEWSGCMSLTNFQTATMATAWGQLQTNNGSTCASCHTNGAQGFMATSDEALFFKTLTENRYYMIQYFNIDGVTTPATAKIIINTSSFAGVSNHQPPHLEHPSFDPTNNQGMQALQQFYTLTMARKTAGTCDPPRLTN